MFMCPHDKSAIIIEICFFIFTKKPQIEVVIRADVSENRLPETKNNFSDYDISQPTPSVSLSVPSCSLDNQFAIAYFVATIRTFLLRKNGCTCINIAKIDSCSIFRASEFVTTKGS